MMWGSNVPVTRTPDAHWMAEVRYRGTKVVTRQPGLRGQHQVRRRVAARPGGHRRGPRDGDGPRDAHGVLRPPAGAVLPRLRAQYTDLPFLVTLTERRRGATCPASSSPPPTCPARHGHAEDAWKTVAAGRAHRRPVVPNGSMGFRYTESGWASGTSTSRASTRRSRVRAATAAEPAEVLLRRFETPDGSGTVLRRGVPTRRVGEHLVTTVYDLMLAQYGVERDGLPGEWPSGLRRRRSARTPRPGRRRSPRAGRGSASGSPASSPATPRSPAAAR